MHSLSENLILRCQKIANWLGMTLLFAVCQYYCFMRYGSHGIWIRLLIMSGLFAAAYFFFGKVYDAFLISVVKVSEVIFSQTLAFLMSVGMEYLISCLIYVRIMNPIPYLLLLLTQFLFSVVWSYVCNKYYFYKFKPRRSAVIYECREDFDKLVAEYGMDRKYEVVLNLTSRECLEQIDCLKEVEVVFLSGVHSKDRNVILKYCINEGILAYVIPRVGDLLMSSGKPVHMFHLPMYRVNRYDPSPFYLLNKRIFDILVSGLALIVLSPVFLVTAIAIKATDGGPVFYKQERMTKDGKKFMIHKFRSMRVDAEKDGVARLSTGENDDRITPVGHFIRKVRIDELPQMIDILQGNLSVVGPRPEREAIALEYEKEIPEFRLRLQCKAGLTGYAQVYGKYNTSPYDKLQMDLMYIAKPSMLEDIRICFATVKILFLPESTDGVEAGAVNALGKRADEAGENALGGEMNEAGENALCVNMDEAGE